jgi:hypothetical protein
MRGKALCSSNEVFLILSGSRSRRADYFSVGNMRLLNEIGISVAHVAHSPSSNCKLGSRVADVPEMLANKVHVSRGTMRKYVRHDSRDASRLPRIPRVVQKGQHLTSFIGS